MPPKMFNDGQEDDLHQYVFSQDLDKLRGDPAAIMSTMEAYMSKVVELGTYVGFSALAWGKMLKDFHPNTGPRKVVSMELSENFVRISKDLVKLAGLDDVVEVVHGRSASLLSNLTSFGIDKIDYLFIDHWEEFYLPDLKLCEDLNLLHSGSIIIADNTDIPGAPDYLKYVRAGGDGGCRYSSTTLATRGKAGHPNVLEVTTVISGQY